MESIGTWWMWLAFFAIALVMPLHRTHRQCVRDPGPARNVLPDRCIADRFSLLKYGLALVLMFIGVKMLLIDVYKIPIGVSLAVVATLIGSSIWLSLRRVSRAAAWTSTEETQ